MGCNNNGCGNANSQVLTGGSAKYLRQNMRGGKTPYLERIKSGATTVGNAAKRTANKGASFARKGLNKSAGVARNVGNRTKKLAGKGLTGATRGVKAIGRGIQTGFMKGAKALRLTSGGRGRTRRRRRRRHTKTHKKRRHH